MDDSPIINENDVLEIAERCPRAISAYLYCIRNSDEYGDVKIPKTHIVEYLGKSWTKFRNDLRDLMNIGILDVIETHDNLDVVMLGDGYDSALL